MSAGVYQMTGNNISPQDEAAIIAAIRKEERERVLDELVKICKIEIKWWDECGTRIMHEGGIAANRHIINWAESLYGKEQQ
jgi:hypothetical protein